MRRARALLVVTAAAVALASAIVACRARRPAYGPPGVLVTDAWSHDPLRAAAKERGRKLGVALATWFFADPDYPALAAREFDSVTPENETKWYAVEPEPGRFDFTAGDRLVSFAEEHHMRVRGHTLVWHNQLAPWVKGLAGDALKSALLRHVTRTAEHFKGHAAEWDVVNEAIDDDGELRRDSPFTALGAGYLAEAFRAAHAADRAALLFYNDYDIEDPASPKTEAVYRLVKGLKDEGVPLHGVGFQAHVDPRRWPGAEAVRRTLERFAALGLIVELTEIDVPVGAIPGTLADKLAAQKVLARDLVRACLAVEACTGMTFWGLTDRHSWLSTAQWAPLRGPGPHLPLPFDENYRPKPMYFGILEALSAP